MERSTGSGMRQCIGDNWRTTPAEETAFSAGKCVRSHIVHYTLLLYKKKRCTSRVLNFNQFPFGEYNFSIWISADNSYEEELWFSAITIFLKFSEVQTNIIMVRLQEGSAAYATLLGMADEESNQCKLYYHRYTKIFTRWCNWTSVHDVLQICQKGKLCGVPCRTTRVGQSYKVFNWAGRGGATAPPTFIKE